jgi:dihydropteroate synthase
MLNHQTTLNCAGQILSLASPVVMGIINITPDSFFSGSRKQAIGEILDTAEQMLKDGASILDIGGMSTRPGAKVIAAEEELQRVLPVVEAIKSTFPEAIISIDTVRGAVARHCAEAGAGMINDISAGRMDEDMYPAVAALQLPYVLMHMQGTPDKMQQNPGYENVALEVLDFLIEEVGKLRTLGAKDIILDPGFGFGKSIEDNYQLLKELHVLQIPDLPVLAGVSRKSMIYKPLNTSPEDALIGTAALHMVALNQGARILRCHDVKEAVQVIELWKLFS